MGKKSLKDSDDTLLLFNSLCFKKNFILRWCYSLPQGSELSLSLRALAQGCHLMHV